MEMLDGAERKYIESIGIAAVCVAQVGNCSIIGATRDLERTAQAWRQASGDTMMVAAWWVKRREIADAIMTAVRNRLPLTLDGMLDADHDRVQRHVHEAAQAMGVKLTEHATVAKRSRQAAERVRSVLNEANQRGDLAWFNGAYRAYRLQRSAGADGRALSYAAARARLCSAMARRLVLVEQLEYGPQLLSEVFGEEFSTLT